jgi:hypothetical protein
MYQEVDGVLVITENDWIESGLTKDQLWKDSMNGYLRIYRRGIKGNTLIEVRSIQKRERMRAIEECHGEVKKEERRGGYSVELDSAALSYFRGYRYDGNKTLPSKVIEEYLHSASILNTIVGIYNVQKISRGKYGKGKRIKMEEFWKDCVEFSKKQQEKYPHSLPTSSRHFERKYKSYKEKGYMSLIHKGYGNKSTEKLTEEAKDWLIARYASQVNRCTVFQLFSEYNEKVKEKGSWKEVKDAKTIRNFLYSSEVKSYWYGSRYGELKSKEKYTRQHKTVLPTLRDSLWYGDGTKLNYYYLDEQGHISTCNVYEVIDVYSECLLGYEITKQEDFEAQYRAYKKAMLFSGYKPYEIRFDNQGGHKKLQSGEFFKGLSRLAINTQPYNGRSKTIESVFGRFQSQYLHKDWFFTGMNITSKKQESKSNMEFILSNKENLPTLEELEEVYSRRREEWNNGVHYKTGRKRIEMYRESKNEKTKKIEILDMIEMFGMINPLPIKYRSNGIIMEVKKERYQYEVLTVEGLPDFNFLRHNVDHEFYVGYDIEDMTTVALYEKMTKGDYRFITIAQKYIEIHRNKQEQDEIDSLFIASMDKQNKTMRRTMQEETEEIMDRQGEHPYQHGLKIPRPKGINKKETIGKVLKKESELVAVEEEEYNIYKLY